MDIITQFLAAMQVLLLVKVTMFLAAGLALAAWGWKTSKRWLILAGLALALGQFAWPLLSNAAYDAGINARREHVRGLSKTPLPAAYPRRLVIDGDLQQYEALWFIAAGYVDEVDIDGKKFVAVPGAEHCREVALALFDPEAAMPRKRARSVGTRIASCTTQAGPAAPGGDAVVLRLGNRTTLFDRENARRHGAPVAIQVSLRRDGKESLAHYDEMPILASPASATRLMTGHYDFPCPYFAYRQILANLLDAARQPGQAARLMQRGAVRRSEYDACIVSPAPRHPGDAKG